MTLAPDIMLQELHHVALAHNKRSTTTLKISAQTCRPPCRVFILTVTITLSFLQSQQENVSLPVHPVIQRMFSLFFDRVCLCMLALVGKIVCMCVKVRGPRSCTVWFLSLINGPRAAEHVAQLLPPSEMFPWTRAGCEVTLRHIPAVGWKPRSILSLLVCNDKDQDSPSRNCLCSQTHAVLSIWALLPSIKINYKFSWLGWCDLYTVHSLEVEKSL